jgi:uroporphyrinogen decarboxylase
MSPTARPKNDTFLRALLRQPVEYTPVWLMRQAGRYLPEYNETRRRAGSFLQLCKNPQLACEVTLQPLARFELDAAILFSDILTVPDAMGLGLYFAEGEGPKFERPLREEWAIRDLTVPDPNVHLRYVMDAVAEIRRALGNSVPLIGFSGSPWTLASYMVEGGSGSATDYRTIKTMLYDRPDLMHHILDVTATAVTDYLNAQIESGAQAVMIFDSWGGVLSHAAYREFSLAYMQRILAGLKREPRRRARALHRVHQGRRAVAGSDCRHRLRCGGPGLDHRSRRSAPARRRAALHCKAISIRWPCSPRPRRWRPKRGACSTVSAAMRKTAANPAATSSISATAFPNSPRPKT